MKKLFCILCALSLLCFGAAADVGTPSIVTEHYTDDYLTDFSDGEQSIPTAATPAEMDLDCKAAILMDMSTGTVLYESNADEQLAPASVTKIMSLLLIMEAIDARKIALDDTVTCSEHAMSKGGSQIWLEVGETMTVDQLLKATAVGSANDATTALAEHVAGSEEGFVARMNERAVELGMKNTNFVNCTGLDADNHYTSARDIAIMSSELMKHEFIQDYTTIWMDTLRGGQTQLVNTNKLVRFYQGATGLKTGTTDKAGHCLSATATRDGLNLVAVVLGSSTGKSRFASAKKLLDYGFANFESKIIAVADDLLHDVNVTGGTVKKIGVEPNGTLGVLINKGDAENIETEIKLPDSVEAPITAGDTVGHAVISLSGDEIGQIDLIATQTAEKMTYWRGVVRLAMALFKA